MVKDTRTKSGADAIRALNRPRELPVKADGSGLPVALKLRRHWFDVESIADRWRIDDEWWREQPVSRMYYECLVDQGLKIMVYQDLISRRWYWQSA